MRDSNGLCKFWNVHRLVLFAFVGLPKKDQVCRHLDGNPAHNCRSNLRWGTSQENSDDKERHGHVLRGMNHGRCKLTDNEVFEILTRRDAGETSKSLAKCYKISLPLLQGICNGHSRKQLHAEWIAAHGRAPRRFHKLTDEDVYTILTKVDVGETLGDLAAYYKVTSSLISGICRGKIRPQIYRKWVEDFERIPYTPRLHCKLTPKKVYTIITKVDGGESSIILAERYRISTERVYKICRGKEWVKVYNQWIEDHGRIPLRTNGNRKLTDKDIKHICKLYRRGVTVATLAKKYSVNASVIYKYLRRSAKAEL